MDKNAKIGIFDSGIGGVTVLKEILKVLAQEDIIYYSDSKNNPYGDKTNEEILNYSEEITKFLIDKGCKAIVIACNTASASSAQFLRGKYKEIPIIAIEPAYKMVHDYAYSKGTLVLATKATIESEKFNLLFNKYDNHKTILLPCVGLAEIIEEGNIEKVKEYLKDKLTQYCGKIENVVLGCTHYPLIKKEIKEILGNVQFFDGAPNLARHLKEVLDNKDMLANNTGKIEFIDSKKSQEKEKRFFEILNK